MRPEPSTRPDPVRPDQQIDHHQQLVQQRSAVVARGQPLTRKDGCMLDHLSIQCADVAGSAAFYDAVLAALGGSRVMDFGDVIGFGVPPRPEFWIGPQTSGTGFRESHIAFTAPDRATVRAFFQAAVAANAEVLHEPRVWPEYHPAYFGAFVRDPDGNNVEAVCHAPE
jgi:catechol 2,3-dioxygenase-like lactoylglutathione lyase family enzyme